MLKYRLLTAVILIPLLFWAIYALPPVYYGLMMAVFIALSAWEWARLVGITSVVLRMSYILLLVLCMMMAAQWLPFLLLTFIGFLLWIWASVAIVRFNRGLSPCAFQYSIIGLSFGFIVLLVCWLSLMVLRAAAYGTGEPWVIVALLVIWAADTGGYAAGRLWGKHSLVTKVSPKKTWEGLCGGVVLAVIVGFLASFLFSFTMTERFGFLLMVLVASVFSVVGDLTVSLFKRQSGVKDSGHILPGHGGILDRVDSIASGIVIFALGSVFF